jgi:hypothetical protein
MKKETLDKARELEHQIEYYDKIAYAMSFPWQKFKLFGRQAYIGAAGYNQNLEITLNDKQLAEIIELYCRTKKLDLQKELEDL